MLALLRTTYLCFGSCQSFQPPTIDPALPYISNLARRNEPNFERVGLHPFRSSPHRPARFTNAVLFLSPNKNTFFSDLLTMRTLKNRMKLILTILVEWFYSGYSSKITTIPDDSRALFTLSGVFIMIFYIPPGSAPIEVKNSQHFAAYENRKSSAYHTNHPVKRAST